MRTVIGRMHQGRKRATTMKGRSYTGAVKVFSNVLSVLSRGRLQHKASATPQEDRPNRAFEQARFALHTRSLGVVILLAALLVALPMFGQNAPPSASPATSAPAADPKPPDPKPPDPQPLPMPSMAGPLQTAVPHEVEGGKLAVTGILSGIGWTEGNHIAGDSATHFDISNAQLFVQKTSGWWQFYLQGGAYNLPSIGAPFLSTSDTLKNIYGPFPQGYLKLVKGNFNVEIGALPTLIGAEYTFSFQNMNIERGLLWNQENAVNRGIQLNE